MCAQLSVVSVPEGDCPETAVYLPPEPLQTAAHNIPAGPSEHECGEGTPKGSHRPAK